MSVSIATSNVIALWRRKDTMTHPLVSDVIRYWDGLRGTGHVPARADIDPRAIQDALSYSFILDRARPGVVRFRLSGSHLNELMGMEVRGMPVRAFFELTDRKRLMEHVETVFTGPCALDIELVSDAQGRRPLEGRMVLLPLRDASGEVSRALGALVTDGLIGLPPRRFRIRRLSLTPLQPGRPLHGSLHDGTAAAPGLAEPPEPYRAPPGTRPSLQVVKGGKP